MMNKSEVAELKRIAKLPATKQLIDTLEQMYRTLKSTFYCGCRCSTHGIGCSVMESTCRLEKQCQKCKFLDEYER